MDTFNSLDPWFTARQTLEAEGHDIDADRCELCWAAAQAEAARNGGEPADYYDAIVRAAKDQAMKGVA